MQKAKQIFVNQYQAESHYLNAMKWYNEDVLWLYRGQVMIETISSLSLFLCGVYQMMPQGIIWYSLGDASRHHLVFTGWCLKASSGIHWVMPQGIIWYSLGDASRHHHLVFTGWCLKASSGIHWVMPQGIIWYSLGDASRHHLVFTGWCLKASSGIHWVMP